MFGFQAVFLPKKRPTHAKPKRGRPVLIEKAHYRARNVIERCVGWLTEHRALVTRYEEWVLNYLMLVKCACIRRCLSLVAPA